MKRELKPEEHEEIVQAITAGDRVKATSIYLSATEGNLTDKPRSLVTLARVTGWPFSLW
jgi:DNA-binding GntR family transcriptional regulator